MATTKPQPFKHAAFKGGAVDVWPKDNEGVLNYGLDLKHFHAPWDAPGEKKADASAGFFPTVESLALRAKGEPPRDGLGNIRGGLNVKKVVRVITLTAGKYVFRFTQDNKKDAKAPFCGPWWTTALGFENMLARVGATYESSAIGVAGGKDLKLRDYARKYSAVFTDWSAMDIVGVSKVLKPIRCFMGHGAELSRDDVHVKVDGIERVESETFDDSNVQLYIPNLWGQLGVYLTEPKTWTPEQIDAVLSKTIQDMRKKGTTLAQRKLAIVKELLPR
jgi:hypothetical protein